MTVAVGAPATTVGWIRDPTFDAVFVGGVAALALLSGAVVVAQPALFAPILLLDLWLLGYHHVVSTYTRLCFDTQSLRANRFLMFGLPVLVLGGVVLLIVTIGAWTIPTLYLYWQWFHYTRQSYGVAKVYQRKAGQLVREPERLSNAVFYLLPLWGILHRSYQAPSTFLGMELRVLPVTSTVVQVTGAAAVLGLAWWLAQRLRAWHQGRLPVAHTTYLLSHYVVFFVGYIVIEDINHGWLVLNVWHNAQYVLFVWFYNTNRFRNGIDPKAKFLSTISQPKNMWLYFITSLGISTTLYAALGHAVSALQFSALPVALVLYQTINFHHYVVDSLIWKVRRKPLQKTLGIAA